MLILIVIIIIIIILFYLLLSKIMELPIFFVSPGLPCLVNILEVKSSMKDLSKNKKKK